MATNKQLSVDVRSLLIGTVATAGTEADPETGTPQTLPTVANVQEYAFSNKFAAIQAGTMLANGWTALPEGTTDYFGDGDADVFAKAQADYNG
jgi:membrane glycosyltransferase